MVRAFAFVALTVALGGDGLAQQASASLRLVQSGELSAGDEPRNREMCLRGGAYVLTFRFAGRTDIASFGFAHVNDPPNNIRLSGVIVTDAAEADWGWRSFKCRSGLLSARRGQWPRPRLLAARGSGLVIRGQSVSKPGTPSAPRAPSIFAKRSITSSRLPSRPR